MTFKSVLLTTVCAALLAAPMSGSAVSADETVESTKPKGPSGHGHYKRGKAKPNNFWWPDQLDLSPLRDHDKRSNPMGADFNYKAAFEALDLDAVKADVAAALTDEQDWWPADWGNYGPLFVRMTWHAAGTYRTLDGRGGADGGQQRFEPTASWPDNGNLDKARRILWPVKQKYGASLSWGDLIVLAGTHGMEEMGFQTYGFAGGRTDDWEPDLVYWGPEVEMLASDREDRDGKLQRPLGAIHMGLIYVNPQGPKGKPDPVASAKNIRVSFGRMAMNDEETVALVAGGHTFGKMHGAHKGECVGPDPAAAPIEQQGLGWKNSCGKGHSEDTMTSGFEGAWTQAPIQWTNLYLENLLGFEWEQTTTPAGAIVWVPTDQDAHTSVPDAHVEGKYNPPVMTTADLALKFDPEYRKVAERFRADPDAFRLAYAKAWYKLTHRDMGPRGRFLQDSAPSDDLIWTDPVPTPDYRAIKERHATRLKKDILESGVSVSDLVHTAWASASSFRAADKRGGANGARIRFAPMNGWAANNSDAVGRVLTALSTIQEEFNSRNRRTQVSMADLIVLGGAAAIEKAAKDAGIDVDVPFTPGRGDALEAHTDPVSYGLLEPTADAFRNFYHADKAYRPALEMLIDRADQLNLTVPEMTALIGGLRVLGANTDGKHGVFTANVGTLSTDYFRTLLSMQYKWRKTADGSFEGVDRASGEVAFTATDVDLVFGAHAELRTVAETYAYDGADARFAQDFVNAWVKVMQLDRFDLKHDL